MRRAAGLLGVLGSLVGAAGRSAADHWALAGFSLVAAFGIWVAIQDVDNPRVTGDAPFAGSIAVEAFNVPDGYIVEELQTVTVRVEARKGDIEELTPADFRASIDVRQEDSGVEGEFSRPVRVESKRRGVDVLEVRPASVTVKLTKASEREVPVTVRQVTPPPAGFSADDSPAIVDPPVVRIQGRQELVESVASVDLDANLGTARDEKEFEVEGDLVARTADGNQVRVTLSTKRARATFKVRQVFTLRSIGVLPNITGSPAPGFYVANVVVDPPVVQITGPKVVLDGLKDPLSLEAIDIGGAQRTVRIPKQIKSPPNVAPDRQTVDVRVEILPLECGANGGSCATATLLLAPTIEGLPAGLVVDAVSTGGLTVQVRVSGPVAQLAALRSADFKAVISLAGAAAGATSHIARVTGPPGVKVESVEPVVIVLRP